MVVIVIKCNLKATAVAITTCNHHHRYYAGWSMGCNGIARGKHRCRHLPARRHYNNHHQCTSVSLYQYHPDLY
jgi:hypothetical protein